MKIWDIEIWTVSDKPKKNDSEYWEHWATETVVADTIEVAIQKAVGEVKEGSTFFKVEARKAELVREVDVE